METGNSIIRQMDEFIIYVLSIVVEDWKPYVAFLVAPDNQGIEIGNQNPLPDVEFSFADDEWPFDVFLCNPEGLFRFYVVFYFN